ncbi:MAG: hypothetical protein QNI87_03230 [Erythrobacter sp.]|uniref:hypothetical protein n=1 Tax=Erythrobacter sp. TaxID=1042 RepID=UPI00261294F3|nr:hypothetical protein [Erythrobacter sp.]MDJ0977524.1 hypothetical protein [Erythrobacter sp.]
MAWKSKPFTDDNWAAVRDRFDILFAALGSPESMALLLKGSKALGQQELYLFSDDPSHANSLSDGGWEEAGPPEGDKVTLLTGDAGFCKKHGIVLGL